MKGIWNEKEPEDVFNTWSASLEEYNKEIKSVRNELQAHGYFEELRFEAFSDTIVISPLIKYKVVGVDRGCNPLWWRIMSMGELLNKLFLFITLVITITDYQAQ